MLLDQAFNFINLPLNQNHIQGCGFMCFNSYRNSHPAYGFQNLLCYSSYFVHITLVIDFSFWKKILLGILDYFKVNKLAKKLLTYILN